MRGRTESVDAPRLGEGARLRMGGDTPFFLGEYTRSVPPERKERNEAGARGLAPGGGGAAGEGGGRQAAHAGPTPPPARPPRSQRVSSVPPRTPSGGPAPCSGARMQPYL